MDLKRLMGMMRRQLLLVLVAVIVTGAVAYELSSRKPDEYQTSASLLLLAGRSGGGTFSAGAGDIERFASVQVELMKSPAILARVAEDMGNVPIAPYSVGTGRTPDILVVTARSPLPLSAQMTADAVVDAYIDYRSEEETSQLRRSTDLLQEQTDEAFAAMTTIDSRIVELQGIISFANANTQFGDPVDPAVQAAQIELTSLIGQRPSLQSRYETLFRTYQDQLLQIELQGKTAERLTDAPLPLVPSSPKPRQALMFGLFAGLILGIGAAAVREQLDTRVRTRKELEERLRLPVLAELPFDRKVKRHAVRFSEDDTSNPLREPIRALRTSIEILSMSQPIRRILVTSALPGEGKTTVVTALGSAFAGLGRRVVIVSADLRRPAAESQLEVDNDLPGVTDYILRSERLSADPRKRVNPNDYVSETSEENLYVLTAGTMAPNAAELLAGHGFAKLLDALSETFDVILVDSPPLLVVSDAAIAARSVDAVLAVASLKGSRRDPVQRFAAALAAQPARVLGVAINKSKSGGAKQYGDSYEPRTEKPRKKSGPSSRRSEPPARSAVGAASVGNGSANGHVPGEPWAAPAPPAPPVPVQSVLVVCRANECRSPAAAAMFRHELGGRANTINVRSAGLAVQPGRSVDPVVTRLLAQRGLDVSQHSARQVDSTVVAQSGLIVAMTRRQVRSLVADHDAPLARTFTLRELARLAQEQARRGDENLEQWLARIAGDRNPSRLVGNDPDDDIDDPTGESEAVYRAALAQIEQSVRMLCDQIVTIEV